MSTPARRTNFCRPTVVSKNEWNPEYLQPTGTDRAVLPASPGWEKVADYALDWALEHAALPITR